MPYDVPSRVPGGTYFFTLRLADPQSHLLVDHVDLLRQAIRIALKSHPFEIRAAVVLPAKLHMIWTLPQGDANYGIRWRVIKSTFSRHIPAPVDARLTPAMLRRREKGIWQRRYWEHLIRDQADYDLHEHLIIHAPVTEGLVKQPGEWALSSLHTRGRGQSHLNAPPPIALQKTLPAAATQF
ncbi:MAG: transposase [Pseudomonadota bacterium]